MRFCLLLVLIGSLASAAGVSGQTAGIISGTVTDESNRPLPGTRITIVSAETVSPPRSTVTDAKGRYEIANLAPGSYRVTGDLPGFQTGAKSQRVTSGRREVWLVMEPAALRESNPVPAGPPTLVVPLLPRR